MIPLSSRDKITYTDEDSVTWTFKSKTGERERRLIEIYEKFKTATSVEWMDLIDPFIDDIVVSCSVVKDGNFSQVLNQEEKSIVISYWHKANSLSVDEKKS